MDRVTFRQNVYMWPYTAMEEVRRYYERTRQHKMEALMTAEIERHKRVEQKLREEMHSNGTGGTDEKGRDAQRTGDRGGRDLIGL